MKFTKEQKSEITKLINSMDYLQPRFDKAFKKYNSAKVGSLIAGGCSATVLLMYFFGVHEFKEAFGTVGMGIMLAVVIFALFYFLDAKKKYGAAMDEEIKLDTVLRKFGLRYTPKARFRSESRLKNRETLEEVDIKGIFKNKKRLNGENI